jgi:hypothetical protein
MRDEELREMRRLAQLRDDPGEWSKLAHVHVRLGQFDEAGEALVRARAVGEADPAVEDALEECELDDAVLRVVGVGEGWLSALAWSVDSQDVFGASERFILRASAPDWRLTRIADSELTLNALATDLDKRRLYCGWGYPDERTRNTIMKFHVWGLELADPRRRVDLPRVQTEQSNLEKRVHSGRLAAWGPTGVVFATNGRRLVTTRVEEKGEPSAKRLGSVNSPEDSVLAWNGDFVPAPDFAEESLPTRRAVESFLLNEALARELAGLDQMSYDRAAVSPSGRFVVLLNAFEGEPLRVIDLVTRKVRGFPASGPWGGVFAPSGRKIAFCAESGLAVLELGADPLASLDQQWRDALAHDRDDHPAFFERLVKDRRPQVTEWLLRQLEGNLEDEHLGFRIDTATRSLAGRRELLDLDRLERARRALEGRPTLAALVERLERIVRGITRGERCLCSAGFDTPREHGQLEAVEAHVSRCRACGRRWRIIEDSSYQLRTYEITELP